MRFKFPGAVPSILVVAVAALALMAVRDEGEATNFAPTATVSTTPIAGSNASIVIETDFPADGSIFSSVLTFIPGSFGLGECAANNPAGVTAACADLAVPDGAVTGLVASTTTLGLSNGLCNNALTPSWQMMDATTDTSETVTFHDDPLDADDTGEQFEDADGNGLPDGVDKYPEYLLRLLRDEPFNPFDPGASSPLQPIQRTYGQQIVASEDVSLQFVMFPPGTKINGFQTDPAWGFMSVLVIQDTGDPGKVVVPQSITDFCAPNHSTTTLYGITRDNPSTPVNERGYKYVTFPVPGPTGSIILPSSEYDADDDGIENTLDTCPFNADTTWNPKVSHAGDTDLDGIPDTCDPFPAVANPDQDGDGFDNRGDNCPLIVNPTQSDLDRDDLGDECEVAAGQDPAVPTGHNHSPVIEWGALVVPPKNGDSNCDSAVTAIDALMVLRYVAGLQPVAGCMYVAGDVDCDADIDAVDALKILRHLVALPVGQEPACTPLGDEIT